MLPTFLPRRAILGVRRAYAPTYRAPMAAAPPVKVMVPSVGYQVTHTLPAETPRRVRLHPMSAQEREGDDRLEGRSAWRAFMRPNEAATPEHPLGIDIGWRIRSRGVEYDVIDSNAGQTAPELERRLVVVRATE